MALPPSTEDNPHLSAVVRSRSFGPGSAAHRRAGSGTLSSDGSYESDTSRYSWQGSEVLGQAPRSPRESRRSLGLPAGCKLPKQPRVRRAGEMTDALIRGVRESIGLEQEEAQCLRDTLDSASLHSAQSQGRLYETERRLRFTERYIKRLECHLAEIEELMEEYGKQQKLREAAERIAAAFSASTGAQSQRGLAQARSGFKECTDQMCVMEAHLQSKMGTLLFELKGIQGFARLCVGDVYEICVRLGSQEWRARGAVGRDQVQRWNRPRRIFKPTLGDRLLIKASEVKTLGKHVLGTKVCEIGDLLSAHTQQMVIYLNATGSLKLSLIVTWSPIESFPEDTLCRSVSAAGSSPGLRRRTTINSPRLGAESRLSAKSSNRYSGGSETSLTPTDVSSPSADGMDCPELQRQDTTTPDILRRTGGLPMTAERRSLRDSCSSADSSGELNTATPADPEPCTAADTSAAYTLQKRPELKRDWYATVERKNKKHKLSVASADGSVNGESVCSGDAPAPLPSADPDTPDPEDELVVTLPLPSAGGADGSVWRSGLRLRWACLRLSAALDAVQGRYPQLAPLESALRQVVALLPRSVHRQRRWSQTSDVSVESALEKFSFLSADHPPPDPADCKPDLLEPGMTARTSDSGIASIVHQLSDTAPPEPSVDGSSNDSLRGRPPDGSSLGLSDCGSVTSQGAEPALVTCQRPLDACLEMHLLYCVKLFEGVGSFGPLTHRTDSCVEKLTRQAALVELMLHSPAPADVISDPQIQGVWSEVCGGTPLYFASSGEVCSALTNHLKPRLDYRDSGTAGKVARLFVCRCLDLNDFTPENQLTVFALRAYTDGTYFDRIIEELAEEVGLTDTLLSHNAESIQRRLSQLVYMFPPRPCLRVVCRLLTSAGHRVGDTVRAWLRDVAKIDSMVAQLAPAFTEVLESDSAAEREGAVWALSQLASAQLTVLAFLAGEDPAPPVRAAAERALLELGAEGRAALQQVQRARAGFDVAGDAISP